MRNVYGRTPLFYAVGARRSKQSQHQYEVTNMLLGYGADPSIRDKWGNTALDIAIELSKEYEAFLKIVKLLKLYE